MSLTIWIARHANRLDFVHPEWFNTAKKRYDPPLSEDGLKQAQMLAERLHQEQITHLVSSPFLRTVQTAQIVAEKLDLSVKLEAGLSEWHNPHWMSEKPEIHNPQELKTLYPCIDLNYRSQLEPQYPETEEQVLQRMKLISQKIINQFSGNILLIGHSVTVAGIAKGLLLNPPEIKHSLCSLTKLVRTEANWQLTINGDDSFLA